VSAPTLRFQSQWRCWPDVTQRGATLKEEDSFDFEFDCEAPCVGAGSASPEIGWGIEVIMIAAPDDRLEAGAAIKFANAQATSL
jgi:hypothetical protein